MGRVCLIENIDNSIVLVLIKNVIKKILESIICVNYVMMGLFREIMVVSKGCIICLFCISGIENIVYGYCEGYVII